MYTISMDDRITGYVLLISGIVIMIFAVLQMALLAGGLVRPFQTFKFTEVFSTTQRIIETQQDLTQGRTNNVITEERDGGSIVLNPQVANDVLNYASYFFLMAFAVNLGGKLADLGVKMIRPTTIKVHPKNIEDIVDSMPTMQGQPPAGAPVGQPSKSLF